MAQYPVTHNYPTYPDPSLSQSNVNAPIPNGPPMPNQMPAQPVQNPYSGQYQGYQQPNYQNDQSVPGYQQPITNPAPTPPTNGQNYPIQYPVNQAYAQIQPVYPPAPQSAPRPYDPNMMSQNVPQSYGTNPMVQNIPSAYSTNSAPNPMVNGKTTYPQPIMMTSGQNYPVANNAFPGQVAVNNYKDPNRQITLDEWESSQANISLIYDKNIIPSDGFDCPRYPNINTKINCNPNLLRCTLTSIPSSSKLLSKSRLPLGLVVQPFRDLNSLCVLQTKNIVRCRNCRTYINPFVQFRDSGRRWQCSVCLLNNAVPDDFFYDPVTKYHGDPTRRPEIKSTTVEYIATSEYNNRPPQAPTYVFCLNANRDAVVSGALTLACEKISSNLMSIPGDSRRQIAIIAYDSAIHFYKLNGEHPKELVCPDVDEIFIPDSEGIFCPLESGMERLDELLTQIPQIFANTNDTGNCLGAALQAAFKLVSKIGGRITLINCTLPTIGPGSLKNREETGDGLQPDSRKLQPSSDFYKLLGLECAQSQVAVDIFSLNSQYTDLATISNVSRFSSGHLFYYPIFNYIPTTQEIENLAVTNPEEYKKHVQMIENWKDANSGWVEAERFKKDFDRYMSRRIGFDAVMRTRYTRGLSINTFHGSQFIRSVDLLALPNLSPDAGFAIQLDIAEEITDPYVILQVALLYTSSQCDRRIRVHTLCLPVVHTVGEVFQGADQGAIAALLGKMAVERCITSSLGNAREALVNALADAVTAFNSNSNNGKQGISSLILPSNLRLLPLYIMGLLKCRAFRNHCHTRLDDRSAALDFIKCAPICNLLPYIYPILYPLENFYVKDEERTLLEQVQGLDLEEKSTDQPVQAAESDSDLESTSSLSNNEESESRIPIIGPIRLSTANIKNNGVYLLDQGHQILILVNMAAPPDVLSKLFSIENYNKFPRYGCKSDLPPLNAKPDCLHPTRKGLRTLLSGIIRERSLGNSIFVMRQDGPPHMKARILDSMVEDRSETAMNFAEFLQSVQANCNK